MPRRLDPDGVVGPTRGQARGGKWRQVAPRWYVPTGTDSTVVEQRIIEQSVRLPATGGVTAWAALRWRGATFFDGTDQGGRRQLPVPLAVGAVGNVRDDPRSDVRREQFAPYERETVDGLPCATVARALFDEMRRCRHLRPGVIAVEMTIAARLIRLDEMADYVATRQSWKGVPLARRAMLLATGHSRSPQEVRMRLIWELDAGLPQPLCNRAVFDLDGRLLGYPDLFDPVAGLVGEYDGADHRAGDRHQADVAREELFRDHNLEYFKVVGDDLAHLSRVIARMHAARQRAKFLPPESCSWTLDPPPWWTGPLHR